MKRKITFLLSALFALILMTQPTKVIGQKTTYEYVLVTNISQLSQGDVILITNSKTNGTQYALGTTQNSNNRKAESVSISSSVISTLGDAQEITLESKNNSGYFTFKVGTNSYLYAANSQNGSNNYLKSKNDNAVYWEITITTNNNSYVAAITDQTSNCNSRNKMKYNANNNNPIFSCYSSADNNLFVFKKQATGGGEDPSITLGSTTVNAPATAVSTTSINVTYNNLTNYDADVIFYESDGTTAASYDHSWMTAEINATTKNLDYSITANTGAARTAYLKVYALGDEGDAESDLITVTQAALLSNIAALTENTESGTYYVTFDDAVVTYTNGVYAFIQDASGAVMMYKNSHGLTAGDVLNGTATVSYKLQDGTPEITSLSGVESESGEAPDPTTVVASAWNYTFSDVLSQYFKITDATISYTNSKYYVSLGSAKTVESIQLYKPVGGALSDLNTSSLYTIIGFPMLYVKNSNTTKELQIFVVPMAADIDIDDNDLELSYEANNNGSIAVDYSYFEPTDVVATLYSDEECTQAFPTSGPSAWIVLEDMTDPFDEISYSVSENTGDEDRTVYMEIVAENTNGSMISEVFEITQLYHQTYSVTYKNNGGTGDDVVDSPYNYNATVTVKPNNGTGTNPGFTKTGYDFQNWNTAANGSGTSYDPADNEHNTFNITANTNLFAQWQAHPYTLKKTDMTNGDVSFKVNTTTVTQATIGQTVTIVVSPASGYKLSNLTVTNDATSGAVTVTNSTFTMPASSVTVSATFEVKYSYDIDFESAANTYTNWTFTNMTSAIASDSDVTAHGGSKFGTTGGNSTASITTNSKIATPVSLTCYVSKKSTNTTASSWSIQVSTNGSSWTTVGETQSATSMDKGEWVEFTRDLSSYSNVYVRVYYGSNTAVRCIDDLSLEYIPSEYTVTLSSVSGGTISASDGTTTITSGSTNFETGKTITLTAEGDATHMFSSWNVTETVSGDEVEVTDNSFEMPACAVTVSATFVESWTFTYNINGHVVTEKYPRDNESKSLISASEFFPEGFSLRGWTENESDVSDPKTSATASQNRTFYAVFGKNIYGDFVKVESSQSDWSGYYLIVYENGSVALDGSKTGSNLDATPNSFAVSISSKTIEYNSTTEAAMFTIAKNGDYYTICSASGYYIGRTSNSNGFDYSTNTKYNHTIAYNSGVTVTSSAGPKLQYFNSGNNSKFRYYSSSQTAIALYKSGLSLEGSYTNVIPSDEVATDDILITSPTIIPAGSILNMGDHELSIGAGGSLVIEDGGQLICNNSVAATVKKKIEAPTPAASKDGDVYGWYTISSPVYTGTDAYSKKYVTIGAETTVNLTTGSYDMFAYDEAAQMWRTQKNENATGFDKMYQGQGYIYRNSGNELSFVGNTNVGEIDYHQTITKTGTGDLAGFNLIGNPYTHSITKGSGKAIYNANFSEGFYVLEDDAWVTYSDGDEIKANQGILIKTSADVENFQIKDVKYVAPAKSNGDNIKFIVSNGQSQDVAYALFDKGIGLDKINHRSPVVPMLYINQDGQDYAIATMSDDTKAFNLNFKAGKMGKYTLSFNANDHFNYLHLIDLLTGEDVDMLLEKEYSFIATPNDKENRFIVKLGYNPNNEPSSDDIFAYQSGSEIYVTGNGELQIFDITGRRVMTTTINGAESINIPNQGVYIFRLNEKVQKIVVR